MIDGREEGLLTLRGIFSGIQGEGDALVFDIGGGSTEYTLAHDETSLFTKSLATRCGTINGREEKYSCHGGQD